MNFKGETILAKKQNSIIKAIGDVFRRLSITVNLTVHSIYLIFLIYSISADVGVLYVNIALAVLTAVFMAIYLYLRLSPGKSGKEVKLVKRYYKRFKMIAKSVSSITAVYALLTAIDAVSPFALIIAGLGAVFTVIRLVVELISYFIQKKLRRIKDNIVERLKKRDDAVDEAESIIIEDASPSTVRRRKKRRNDDAPDLLEDLEEKIIHVDDSLLNEMENV